MELPRDPHGRRRPPSTHPPSPESRGGGGWLRGGNWASVAFCAGERRAGGRMRATIWAHPPPSFSVCLWFLAHTLSHPISLPRSHAQILSWLLESKHKSYVQGGTLSHMQTYAGAPVVCLPLAADVKTVFHSINNKTNLSGVKWSSHWRPLWRKFTCKNKKGMRGGGQAPWANERRREGRYGRRAVYEELISERVQFPHTHPDTIQTHAFGVCVLSPPTLLLFLTIF